MLRSPNDDCFCGDDRDDEEDEDVEDEEDVKDDEDGIFSAAASSVPSSSRGSQAQQLTLTQVQIWYVIRCQDKS